VRLWSLHPSHLDRQGLTACWREALLAQAVLAGRTRGYLSHSQLIRFREQPDPLRSVGAYLVGVAEEAAARGYHFDRSRIDRPTALPPDPAHCELSDPRDGAVDGVPSIPVTAGQVAHEWQHLLRKLALRSPDRHTAAIGIAPDVHPLFHVVPGPVAEWERV
jgi:hypothetical protein